MKCGAASFFSEAAPLGVVGSCLLDKLETQPEIFRFKHHYILSALDSEVLYALFLAMGENRMATLQKGQRSTRILPPENLHQHPDRKELCAGAGGWTVPVFQAGPD